MPLQLKVEKNQFLKAERFNLELLDNCLSASTNRELTKKQHEKRSHDSAFQDYRSQVHSKGLSSITTNASLASFSGNQCFKDPILVRMFMSMSLLQNAAHLQFLSCILQSENEDLHHEALCFYLSSYLHTYKSAGNTTLTSWIRAN